MFQTATFKLSAVLGVGLLIAAGAMRVQRDEARTALADYRAQVAQATARAEAKDRAQENELRGQAEQLRTAFEKESQNAEIAKNRLLSGIRAGTERLSIAAHCPAASQAGADSAAAPSTADGQRAELDPQVAETLVAIAAEGDAAIIERNACVAQYNQVRQLMDGD